MQEQLQKLAVSKQEVLHCLGIVGAGFLYSLGINLFVVPAGLYTGGIMGFAQLLRTLFLHVTGLELKIDIAGIINYAINLPILCIAWRRIDHRVVFKTLLSVTSTTVFLSLVPRTGILGGDKLAECLIGGMLCGCGIGITLWMGGTSGGMVRVYPANPVWEVPGNQLVTRIEVSSSDGYTIRRSSAEVDIAGYTGGTEDTLTLTAPLSLLTQDVQLLFTANAGAGSRCTGMSRSPRPRSRWPSRSWAAAAAARASSSSSPLRGRSWSI